MGDHLQAHRLASIEKIALPDKKKALFHARAPSPGHHHHHHHHHGGASSSSHEAPAASITTPRTAAAKQLHLPGSPRACLCSPTVHAGSFRCRLHRGIGGSGGGGGSVGSGLNGMSKKPGGV
ncbi:hypothetical protein C2845_PM09G17820 [Panicum miliaceum]|uniref:Uncharacterized protein n=1 Tax=Panicum miliaceum TaxID=4540 RepID=A0A3L6RW77_PANMI|nr:hypothetical protein C2845_PM09G17820 [Panicum miliaceum]